MVLKNKRGSEPLYYTVIYVILNIAFFAALFAFVAMNANNIGFQEKVEARKISLMIDSLRDGTSLTIQLWPLAKIAQEKDYGGRIVSFNLLNNEIKVNLARGEGHSYKYFTKLDESNIRGDGRKEVVISLG